MFSNKVLYIPDYVVYEDVPTIIKYFDYYNIAKVKKVEIFKHIEPEYYVEDNNNYGFALIEIDKYYNNQGAINFYNNLENRQVAEVMGISVEAVHNLISKAIQFLRVELHK